MNLDPKTALKTHTTHKALAPSQRPSPINGR